MNTKRLILYIGIFIFLAMALTLNFVLQKDYFMELGFLPWVIVISILLLDGSKILSEIVFFKYKGKTRIYIGIFSAILILLSAYTTFGVREWKSVAAQLKNDNKNNSHLVKLNRYKEQKSRLDSQFNSLEKQIKVKQDLIASLKKDNNAKWLRHRYNKEIGKLNKEKEKVIAKLEELDKNNKFNFKKAVTLTDALSLSLGIHSENLETLTNAIIAITVEGIIVFLSFSLSHLNTMYKSDENPNKKKMEDYIDYNKIHANDEVNGLTIRRIRKKHDLTQRVMAEKLGIPRGTLAKVETGRSLVPEHVKDKIFEMESTLN